MQSLPYLYDDERPDERTNTFIAQTTTHIRQYTQAQCYFFFLFFVIGAPLLSHPFILFHSFYHQPHSFSFDKEPIKYIYFMLCLFCCLFNGNCKPISHNKHLHDTMIGLYNMKKKILQKNKKREIECTIGIASRDACVPHR